MATSPALGLISGRIYRYLPYAAFLLAATCGIINNISGVFHLAAALSAVAGIAYYSPEFERRVNVVFESYKEELAVKLHDHSIAWLEYESGSTRRISFLCQGFSFQTTLRLVRQNAACDRCKNWNGAERRITKGSARDRLSAAMGLEIKRFTDSAEFFARMCRRMTSQAIYR
jgi:hypothetical protein